MLNETAREWIRRTRLHSQRIFASTFQHASEVVRWLVAAQAQDYFGAKWSLGLRLPGSSDADIESEFNNGAILRTHLLRPTWHFVLPEDIRWLLALTAPRLHTVNGTMYRKFSMDDALLRKSDAVIGKALLEGGPMTRDELRPILEGAGIATTGEQRMVYLLMHAELEGIICSGGRRGNQFTYALLDERAPDSPTLNKQDALVELARRYFCSRGPATVQDFAKWSGLTLTDARLGLEGARSHLQPETIDGAQYWMPPKEPGQPETSPTVHLLSIYDEYISSYKDHTAMIQSDHGMRLAALGNALYYILVLDGQVVGSWKRTLKKESVRIKVTPFIRLSERETQAVAAEADRYAAFLGLKADLALDLME